MKRGGWAGSGPPPGAAGAPGTGLLAALSLELRPGAELHRSLHLETRNPIRSCGYLKQDEAHYQAPHPSARAWLTQAWHPGPLRCLPRESILTSWSECSAQPGRGVGVGEPCSRHPCPPSSLHFLTLRTPGSPGRPRANMHATSSRHRGMCGG